MGNDKTATKKPKVVPKLTRKAFMEHAKTLEGRIDGIPVALAPMVFGTGSYGWNANGKTELVVNGEKVQCQISFNLIAAGSKDLPAEK